MKFSKYGRGLLLSLFAVLSLTHDILHKGVVVLVVQASSVPLQNKILLSGGLINLGNTCYLNSQLECQYHIPLVRDLIIHPYDVANKDPLNISTSTSEDEEENSTQKPTHGLLALQQLFSSMKAASLKGQGDPSHTPSVSTALLCRTLGISPYEQQDSGEFWKLLLPEIQHPSLENLYRGSYETIIAALDGSGKEKKRTETFLDLSLDITNFDTVYDSMDEMFNGGEVLSVKSGNGWRPEKGADKIDALKVNKIRKDGLPKILQLHLMRFKYDWQTETMSKLNHRFVFPLELDLKGLCDKSLKADTSFEKKDESLVYDLQSVVVHAGEFGHGHYYAYIRPNILKNQWFRYDDDRVTEVSFREVKEDAYGGHIIHRNNQSSKGVPQGILGRLFLKRMTKSQYGWGGKTSSAYMLQYVKRSEVPNLFGIDTK